MRDNLSKKAEAFINNTPYFKLVRTCGDFHFTGSYFLDTMTWPDIDMQLCLKISEDPRHTLSTLMAHLLGQEEVQKVQFFDCVHYPRTALPNGFYLGASYFDNDIDDAWKLDLWILDRSTIEQHAAIMERLRQEMTPEQRELIIAIKQEWTDTLGRPPKGGSFALYQAVVFEGMKTREEIESCLKERGINIRI